MKTSRLDTRQQPDRVRNAPDRFSDSKLTVILFSQNNNLSAMSVITVDNSLTSQSGTKV